MALAEDFTVFFDTDEFACTATPNVGAAIRVIFDRAQIAAMGGDISGTSPAALAVSADVSSWASNSTTLVISGAADGNGSYILRDIQPDGTGLSLLVLEVA